MAITEKNFYPVVGIYRSRRVAGEQADKRKTPSEEEYAGGLGFGVVSFYLVTIRLAMSACVTLTSVLYRTSKSLAVWKSLKRSPVAT